MSREIVAGNVDDIAPDGMQQIEVDGTAILVCRSGNSVYAVEATCPHRGAQLGQGQLQGTAIVCPWHDWAFDVKDGCGLTNPNSSLMCYDVKIRDGKIIITVPEV